jgi:branched-chain amino acid transport system ATP-binding protein
VTPVLELAGVHAAYGPIDVLHGVDLRVGRGEVLAVLGPNGAGKTTLVRIIAGLLRPTHGRVLMGGHDVTGVPADRLAGAGLCVVPEGRGVFPRLTVDEHLQLVVGGGRRNGEPLDRVFTQFPRLAERRSQVAGTLSGGEQQMLALARAVARRPALLVIDELSMGLAPKIVEQLYGHVRALAADGVPIVVVEQLAHDVLGVATHVAVLQQGRVVRTGEPDAVAADLADLYLATNTNGAP